MQLNYLYIKRTRFPVYTTSSNIKIIIINDFKPTGIITANGINRDENKVPNQFEFYGTKGYMIVICQPFMFEELPEISTDIHLLIDGDYAKFDPERYPYDPPSLEFIE